MKAERKSSLETVHDVMVRTLILIQLFESNENCHLYYLGQYTRQTGFMFHLLK